jgi:hypothetical protein
MSHAHHLPARQTKPLAAHFTDPFVYLNTSWAASPRERAQKLCEIICFILHMPLPDEASTSSTPIPVDSDRLLAALYPRPDFVHDMERVMVATEASKMVTGFALYYINLFRRSPEMRRPNSYVMPGRECRIGVASMMLAHKFLEDDTYTNSSWATVAGMTTKKLYKTEQFCLNCLQYNLFIGLEDYERWLVRLPRYVAARNQALSNRRSGFVVHR